MNNILSESYRALGSIFSRNKYLGSALNGVERELLPEVTKIVYGVLENNVRYDYYISRITTEKPNKKVAVVLKIGMYAHDFLDSMPDYAVVNECVDLTETIGKKQLKGFVNAALKNYIAAKPEPPKNKHEKMSVEYGVPLWLVKAYCKQYGEEKAVSIMTAASDEREHVRANLNKMTHSDLARLLRERGIEHEEDSLGLGYFVKNDRNIRDLFDLGLITVQSLSSMIAVRALSPESGSKVFDACAAPGGKSVYMSELEKNLKITANELHPVRAELIKKYIDRMDARGITVEVGDAAVPDPSKFNRFDFVLCDVPCSGLGVSLKKPDILLGKTYEDIIALSEIQYKILNNCIDYLKAGGALVYSTCTTLREENYNVIGRTLKERDDVALEHMDIPYLNDGFIQLLSDGGIDGFFIARLRKKR